METLKYTSYQGGRRGAVYLYFMKAMAWAACARFTDKTHKDKGDVFPGKWWGCGASTCVLSLLGQIGRVEAAGGHGGSQTCPPWLLELSRLGRTWRRPGGHSDWGHPCVILTRNVPRRSILESPPPGPFLGTSLEVASHLWALVPVNS